MNRPPFEKLPGGGVAVTGKGIPLFRLLALRGAVKLENLGMRRRGPSASSIVKAELGLGRNAKPDAVLAALSLAIEKAEQDCNISDYAASQPIPRPGE